MIKKAFACLRLLLALGIAVGSVQAASERGVSNGGVSEYALRTKLKTVLDTLDYGGKKLDLSPIDELLVAGAGLDFEQNMLVDFLHITSAEDTLLNEGLILRRFKE